ncbi:MAG TPA: hypothetical protein VMV10_10100 [Pirellulales bacterium]|nr:hypothetical protein [Pirellulales bacterium]
MKTELLEAAVETPKDGNLYFPPAKRTLRGRKDFNRMAQHEKNFMELAFHFPQGIPGTVIRIDLDEKQVWLREPLHEAAWEAARDEIVSRGIALPPALEAVAGAYLPDWLHEIKRSLEAGYLRVVRGALPRQLGEETQRPEAIDPAERRIERLCDLVEKLLETMAIAAAK